MSAPETAHGDGAGQVTDQAAEQAVFALVGAAFVTIYITQPILPRLETEFGASTVSVSLSVSLVLLGIAIANLPTGFLADRLPLGRLLVGAGAAVAMTALVCAATARLDVLLAARFTQGLFLPALTTALAAHLARVVPRERLNVVMGSYVAATITGGMLSRLLGGYLAEIAHWRLAFVASAVFVLASTWYGCRRLPTAGAPGTIAEDARFGYGVLLRRLELWPLFLCGAAGQAIFSPVFNTVAYRLAEPGIALPPAAIAAVYLVYAVGIVVGPWSGRVSNRLGNGISIIAGGAVLLASLALLTIASAIAVVVALLGICVGFFGLHAAAVGAINHHLSGGFGRANAIYILCYYVGAWFGVSWSSWVYQQHGWNAMVAIAMALVAIPLATGVLEWRYQRRAGRH